MADPTNKQLQDQINVINDNIQTIVDYINNELEPDVQFNSQSIIELRDDLNELAERVYELEKNDTLQLIIETNDRINALIEHFITPYNVYQNEEYALNDIITKITQSADFYQTYKSLPEYKRRLTIVKYILDNMDSSIPIIPADPTEGLRDEE